MTAAIWLRGESGALLSASLPLHEAVADRLAKGLLARVNRDGTPWAEDQAAPQPSAAASVPEPGGGEDDAPDPPKRTASQAEWAAYAISQGMDPAEAAGMKRDDLYKEYRRTLRAVS